MKAYVLDIGCGKGVYVKLLNESKIKTLGIDVSDETFKDKSKFLLADCEKKIPFSNNTFSVVLLISVLQHVKKQRFVLSESARVLKKNGYFIVMIPNFDSWIIRQSFKLILPLFKRYSSIPLFEIRKEKLLKNAEENGLKLEEMHYLSMSHTLYPKFLQRFIKPITSLLKEEMLFILKSCKNVN